MSFKDFEAFAEGLKLPIFGETYTIPPIGAKTGARLHLMAAKAEERQRVMDENAQALADAKKQGVEPDLKEIPEEPESPSNRELLGEVVDEMYEDDVPADVIGVAASTAYYDFLLGREAAETYWNSGGDPKALSDYIRARMKLATSGGAGNTTQKPDSTSGTKSKTKNSRSTTGDKKPSATRKSSNSGKSSKARSKPD